MALDVNETVLVKKKSVPGKDGPKVSPKHDYDKRSSIHMNIFVCRLESVFPLVLILILDTLPVLSAKKNVLYGCVFLYTYIWYNDIWYVICVALVVFSFPSGFMQKQLMGVNLRWKSKCTCLYL